MPGCEIKIMYRSCYKVAPVLRRLVMEKTYPDIKKIRTKTDVYYDSKYEVWVVKYSRNTKGEIPADSGGMSVYLSKKTGEVLFQCPF